jgi:hypothetical protein
VPKRTPILVDSGLDDHVGEEDVFKVGALSDCNGISLAVRGDLRLTERPRWLLRMTQLVQVTLRMGCIASTPTTIADDRDSRVQLVMTELLVKRRARL